MIFSALLNLEKPRMAGGKMPQPRITKITIKHERPEAILWKGEQI